MSTRRKSPIKKLYADFNTLFFTANKVKDTKKRDLEEVTFKPKLCSFEKEIMESMGIKEERKQAPTYWY